ncbi:SIS domain-containing protein [Aliarcobacter butzleri]|uniref:SIS domain-containing protein n=1 Tax=Aliarcobacter butzleri TaxID=28197 RepID=UPI0021B4BDD0|nr:SIS domain-containing protein [Aliarcobacter butzleri]MCT7584800.1 SIS domain-containing protein [Aliarcobacter butzleri]
MNIYNFINQYTNNLKNLLDNIDKDEISKIINVLDKCENNNSKIYIMGNGGSAATASHMANDLSVGLKLREIRNFNVESLSDNSSVCTAIANDIGYENIFYAQVKNKLKKDDVVIAISCSGNSANIVKAIEHAKKIGTTIIGLTGFDGGRLRELSDIKFHIDTLKGEYGLVEDLHMILDHIIYSYYISLKPETKSNYTME